MAKARKKECLICKRKKKKGGVKFTTVPVYYDELDPDFVYKMYGAVPEDWLFNKTMTQTVCVWCSAALKVLARNGIPLTGFDFNPDLLKERYVEVGRVLRSHQLDKNSHIVLCTLWLWLIKIDKEKAE